MGPLEALDATEGSVEIHRWLCLVLGWEEPMSWSLQLRVHLHENQGFCLCLHPLRQLGGGLSPQALLTDEVDQGRAASQELCLERVNNEGLRGVILYEAQGWTQCQQREFSRTGSD